MLTIKIEQMTIDGHPYRCPECASEAFTFDGAGFIDALPVWANCWQSHSWQEPLVTLGTLKQIQAASSGRQQATDEDTFEITVGGAVLAGTLHPQITVDDVKQASRVYWRRIAKPAVRRRKRAAIRSVTRPVKKAAKEVVGAVTGTADKAVAATKAAALTAAWDAQTGGHEPDPDYKPEPTNPCAVCIDGYIPLDSHIHDIAKVRCTVCCGTGNID
ncbi:hypothetical protein [Streptomyces sp. NPDC055243]|uniref:hypothetical protein n=1 Tax=Streptomyces sp. NPDC055243 TaxID=3365720 RepID=UPI0037D4815C